MTDCDGVSRIETAHWHDVESLLGLLRARGSTITTGASVRGWVTGITLAPSDSGDIRRLGELFGSHRHPVFARDP